MTTNPVTPSTKTPNASLASSEPSAVVEKTTQAAQKVIELTTSHPNPLETVKKTSELKGWAKYQALLAENQQEVIRPFITPSRRVCGFSGIESEYTKYLIRNAVFITAKEIIKVHPMRFLSHSPYGTLSPFAERLTRAQNENDPIWEERILPDLINIQLQAIAFTESNRHVILQQAAKSCVPTCVGMLVLDHKKTPNYDAIELTNLANDEQAVEWVRETGLTPKFTEIPNVSNKTEFLVRCLKENGSGALGIDHPKIGGHDIVLDEISIENNTAVIRDPFHGWALTIKLNALLSWNPCSLIQIIEK
ncbi:MAG: hypothetical protein WCP39_03850 [Chlamydiota bacterium]